MDKTTTWLVRGAALVVIGGALIAPSGRIFSYFQRWHEDRVNSENDLKMMKFELRHELIFMCKFDMERGQRSKEEWIKCADQGLKEKGYEPVDWENYDMKKQDADYIKIQKWNDEYLERTKWMRE